MDATAKDPCTGYTPECVDWWDLFKKLRCIIYFVNESCSKEEYGDWFLVFKDGSTNQPLKNVELVWYSRFMDRTRYFKHEPKDKRNHEKLLRQHFPTFNLAIKKLDTRWDITISTPVQDGPAQGSTVVVIDNASAKKLKTDQ